jgi:hypothetical protein
MRWRLSMCENAGLLIGWDTVEKRVLVTRANCDRWNCPECAERMAARWVLRAEIGVRQYIGAGLHVDFITVTSHEKLPDFASTERVWREAWPVLYAALKRRSTKLEYFVVPEKHKDGRMHVHALWTADVSQKWLKDNARKRGLGYQAKRRGVEDARRAVAYVGKYIGKSLGTDVPAHFRRVRVSHGWPEIPLPTTPLVGLRWEYISGNGALAVVMAECQAKHIAMIDLQTGEFFDAPDLGTEAASFAI